MLDIKLKTITGVTHFSGSFDFVSSLCVGHPKAILFGKYVSEKHESQNIYVRLRRAFVRDGFGNPLGLIVCNGSDEQAQIELIRS